MVFLEIFLTLGVWSVFGFLIFVTLFKDTKIDIDGLDWLTPKWIYHNYNVNWFGTICLMLFFNLLCPFMSIGFWFYKLCTVGRKVEEE